MYLLQFHCDFSMAFSDSEKLSESFLYGFVDFRCP